MLHLGRSGGNNFSLLAISCLAQGQSEAGYFMRFFGFFAFLLAGLVQPAVAQAPIPGSVAVQTPPELQWLEHRFQALATENPGEYGIAAMDLATGAIVSFNGDEPFPMASTMKIAVAAAYLAEVDSGRRSLDDMIAGVSARKLMDVMITRSDNRATDLLMASLGGPAMIDRWLRSHQLRGMRVDRTIAQLLADRRDLRDVRDSSTPVAMLGLLRLVDSGPALSESSRALLLDMMRRCATGSNRIRGLLPAGAVQNKTGTLNGYTGDVGYLTIPGGQRIAVVFFARGGSNRPAVISTAARAVYDAFGGRAGLMGARAMQANWRPEIAGTETPAERPGTACSLGGQAVAAQC